MNDFSFERWIYNRLIEVTADLGLEGITFTVANEQDYVKRNELKEKHIIVVVKHLTASRVYTSKVMPIQLTILSEASTIEYSQVIFEKFCATYNFFQVRENDCAYKMEFSSPATLNNFNVIGANLRTVIFVSASLVVLENVCDITELYLVKDDGTKEKIDFIGASISYGANMNSIQYAGSTLTNAADGELASSIKTTAALNMVITVPSQNTTIVQKALNIMFGLSSGNANYEFELSIGNVAINGLKLKQQSCTFTTAVNDIPSLQIGFVR